MMGEAPQLFRRSHVVNPPIHHTPLHPAAPHPTESDKIRHSKPTPTPSRQIKPTPPIRHFSNEPISPIIKLQTRSIYKTNPIPPNKPTLHPLSPLIASAQLYSDSHTRDIRPRGNPAPTSVCSRLETAPPPRSGCTAPSRPSTVGLVPHDQLTDLAAFQRCISAPIVKFPASISSSGLIAPAAH